MHRQASMLLQRAYHPDHSPEQLLDAIAVELGGHEVLRNGRLNVTRMKGGMPRTRGNPAVDEHVAYAIPIQHAEQVLAALEVNWRHRVPPEQMLTLCRLVARRCAHLIKRHEAKAWAEARLNRSLCVVGVSEALDPLDSFIERASQSDLPVLVQGEFGTEKAEVAVALHAHGQLRDGPFIEVHCGNPVGEPAQWFREAVQGTLYLHDIDALSTSLQQQLPALIQAVQRQWSALRGDNVTRVIASTSDDLERRVLRGYFPRELLASLDYLTIDVPPMRDRRSDVSMQLERMLYRHGFDANRLLTDDVLQALRRHDWPENLLEMERVVTRLAVMAGGNPIQLEDVQRHAPRILERDVGNVSAVDSTDAGGITPGVAVASAVASPDAWIDALPRPARKVPQQLHEGLRRALQHLVAHHAEPLTLADLARHAHVSPSHLGFLFRDELGTSFKSLLLELRIDRAKELLRSGRRLRVTEVALSVGFGDLSHFEKSFRRVVGVSPRVYRTEHSERPAH